MNIFLNEEVICAIVFLGSVTIVIHAVMGYIRQADALRTRLRKVEAKLKSGRDKIPEKRQRVGEQKEAVLPLKQQHRELQIYYSKLDKMVLEVEKEAHKRGENGRKEVEISTHRTYLENP